MGPTMSDRIDELVRLIRLASTTAEYAADHEAALTELATIAREAEAMCEWLAKQWKVACDSDELPCHICPFADKGAPATCQSAEAMLKAAREAVANER